MIRDHIKKIFSSRIFYIIFSILASLSIWLYVAYIDNDDLTVTVRNIKVEVLNSEYVTDRGLVVTEFRTDIVTLRLTGKRNIVSKLTNVNVTASVDFADIEKAGVTLLEYDVIYPIDVNQSSFTTSKSVDKIPVTVDNLSSKEIKVSSTYDGGVASGYQAEPVELTPALITVSGPQEILSKISYAWVPVRRENISKTVNEKLPFTLMDDSGHEVVSDKLTFSHDTIGVVIPVVMIKEIPLKVNLIYGAGADEANTSYVVTPSAISVSGDAEKLEEINQISLGTGPIDTTKFPNSRTFQVPIVLPDGTKNLTGITEATVTVTITGLESTHVTTDNIDVTNETGGYTTTILTKSFDILLRGTSEDIAKITPDESGETPVPVNYRVVADLSELGETTGTYSVLARVYVDGDVTTVGAVGEYKVTVVITKD